MVLPPWDRAFEVGTIGYSIPCERLPAIGGPRTGEAAAHLYRYIHSDIKLLFDGGARRFHGMAVWMNLNA
jgi:hypothetical protein